VPFKVGDKVAYPHHGAAVIERKEKVEAFGQSRDCFVLRIAFGDLTLKVPIDNADEVGLRAIIDRDEVDEVFELLGKPCGREPANWSRRFKNNVEKLKSGDIYQVAELVRNLSRREQEKHLSAGEKRLLVNSRRVLVSELRLAMDVSEEDAESALDEILTKSVA
jgi:CarD family transcriptional regulator